MGSETGSEETSIDRERIHWILHWTGGECYCREDRSGDFVARKERDHDAPTLTIGHWTGEAPEFLSASDIPGEAYSSDCVTLVSFDGDLPETLWQGAVRLTKFASFVSEETECGCDQTDDENGNPRTETDPDCPMCEGDGTIGGYGLLVENVYVRSSDATRPDDDASLPEAPGPGRLEGEGRLGRYLDDMTADEEAGDVETIGHYRLVRFEGINAGRLDDYADHVGAGHDASAFVLSESEAAQLDDNEGAILSTDSNGFVSVQMFDTAKALNAAWDEIIEMESAEGEESADANERDA